MAQKFSPGNRIGTGWPLIGRIICLAVWLALTTACGVVGLASGAAGESLPFYAMDTAFAPPYRPTSVAEQLDLVRELGFAGVAWTEKAPAEVKADLAEIERRGLVMAAIYCHASITVEGDLTHSVHLPALIALLKGHRTLIWLHITGPGPAIDGLRGKEPVIGQLRELADAAQAGGTKIAIYPHLGDWTERFGDATRLARLVNHPALGVSFNLCHCLATGDEAAIGRLLEQARDVLLIATICGTDAGIRAPHPQLWTHLIQPLGQGTFDSGAVLDKLHEIGFDGPICFQGFGIKGEPRAILTPTMAAWRTYHTSKDRGKGTR